MTLRVHTQRPPTSYAQELKPERLAAFSASAPTALEAVQYTLVHEVGHHLLQDVRARERGIALVEQAFVQGKGISIRARVNWEEYFCECFAAHTFTLGPSGL